MGQADAGAPILILVEDMIFSSKINEAARRLGIAVEPVGVGNLPSRLKQGAVRAAIVDLNHQSALAAVRMFRTEGAPRIPIVGFVSHVQTDLIRAGREAGCDELLARSAFARQLPKILSRLWAEGAAHRQPR